MVKFVGDDGFGLCIAPLVCRLCQDTGQVLKLCAGDRREICILIIPENKPGRLAFIEINDGCCQFIATRHSGRTEGGDTLIDSYHNK